MSQGTLSGRSILITQGKSKSAKMRRLLEERGARVIEIPLIEIRPLWRRAQKKAEALLGSTAGMVRKAGQKVGFGT